MALFAAIDIGTNTVLLTIADVAGGTATPVLERAWITRLGQGVDRDKVLAAEAVTRTHGALAELAREVALAGVTRTVAVGTSALRDARGGDDFLAGAERLLGVRPVVIDGRLEAELTFEGSLSGLELSGPVLVFDVGGGSTELVLGEVSRSGTRIVWRESSNLGSVRLFERIVAHDPPSPEELLQIRRETRVVLAALEPPTTTFASRPSGSPAAPLAALEPPTTALASRPSGSPAALEPSPASAAQSRWPSTLVGVAGTVTTLAALARGESAHEPGRLHGSSLSASEVEAWSLRLASLPLAERRELGALEPGRADVIVVGSVLVDEILRWSGHRELVVSDRGVRWGLLARLARGADPLTIAGKN